MYVRARYTAPKGIGFNTSYTTLQVFYAPRHFFKTDWLPFLDLRGHVFNNGKFAANAGLGLRYLGCSRLWGINAYYDFRDTKRGHYNQVAAGFETLGECFDFRINGYLPVGAKSPAPPFNNSGTFEDSHLILRYSQYYAMKGANAEIGTHLKKNDKRSMYFAAGPYYFTGGGRTAWGGELRVRADLFYQYIRLEGFTSYDHLFKWIGQGQISLNIPFGKRTKICVKEGQLCCTAVILNDRAIEQVDRFEIIPQIKKRTKTAAINPETGKPWVF